MKPLTLQDVVPLSTYRKSRDEYVKKMISYKGKRRISLAEHVSILFENRQTVLFQVLELVHAEDLTDKQEIQEYLNIYNPMIPNLGELSATLFIEADHQDLLEKLLVDLRGIEQHLYLITGDIQNQGKFEEEHTGDVTSSVHYLKFPLEEAAKKYLASTPAEQAHVRIKLTHPKLSAEVTLPSEIVASLQEDLHG